MHQSKSQQITVRVQGPQKKGTHRIYSIIGSDKNGEFNTVKRFSDFDQLRKILVTKWPGCYIPSLPEKKIIGNQEPLQIQMKKRAINSFINILKNLQIIWYAQETQVFLHKIGDTEKDLQKIKQSNVIEILGRYRKVFSEFVDKQVGDGSRDKLIKFGQQMKKMKEPLQSLDKRIEQVYTIHKKFEEKFMSLIETLLPDYEKNCLQVYKNGSEFQQMVLTGQKKQKIAEYHEKFSKNSNSMIQMVREIKRQKQEMESFEELLKIKQNYVNQRLKVSNKIKDLQTQTTKIHGGKESLISKIKKKTKDQQLKDNQIQIQKAQQQQKNLTSLSDVITLLLAQKQIENFKKTRATAYYSLLRSFLECQKQLSGIKKQFWTLVLKQNSLQKEELDNFFESDKSPSKGLISESVNNKDTVEQVHVIQQEKDEQKLIKQTKNYGQEQINNEVKIDVEQISSDDEKGDQEEQQRKGESQGQK